MSLERSLGNFLPQKREIHFTGFVFDATDLLTPQPAAIPPAWRRIRFETENGRLRHLILARLHSWLSVNMTKQWICYAVPPIRSVSENTQTIVVVAFEDDTDAVMFRLKGGETAWKATKKD